jgi:hypothetical protein
MRKLSGLRVGGGDSEGLRDGEAYTRHFHAPSSEFRVCKRYIYTAYSLIILAFYCTPL